MAKCNTIANTTLTNLDGEKYKSASASLEKKPIEASEYQWHWGTLGLMEHLIVGP